MSLYLGCDLGQREIITSFFRVVKTALLASVGWRRLVCPCNALVLSLHTEMAVVTEADPSFCPSWSLSFKVRVLTLKHSGVSNCET
jgi:hypothetical protein